MFQTLYGTLPVSTAFFRTPRHEPPVENLFSVQGEVHCPVSHLFLSFPKNSAATPFFCVSNTVQNSSTLDSVLFHVKARNHLSRACSLCKGKRADPLFFRFQKARAHSSHPKHDTQLSERVLTTKKEQNRPKKNKGGSCHCSTWFCAVEVHGFGL